MTPNVLGGLDPVPPKPGIVALMCAPLALLVVSAVLAYLLSRKDRRHRPVAIGLGVMAVAVLGRLAMDAPLNVEGPHVGWMRAMFHFDQALLLVGVAALPWVTLATLRALPPGPSTRHSSWLLRVAVPLSMMLVALVVGYPSIRGEALRRAYLAAELAALFWCAVAIVGWLRRRGWASQTIVVTEATETTFTLGGAAGPRWYTLAVPLGLVGADAVLLAFGAWRYGLFGQAYTLQQAGLLALYAGLACVQVAALIQTRRP
jgi:hypothetical protein